MRHLRLVLLTVTAVALCAAPAAVAHPPHKGGGKVTPVHKVAGLTGGELLGEAWAELLSHPAGTFSGSCVPLAGGRVLSPEPGPDLTASCTIKRGTPLFLWFGSECSDVEEPPFFGADEPAQRACAVAADEIFTAATLTVDDGEPVNGLDPRFELLSPQQTVELPADNILGVPPQTATFVAHGWGALVKKLRPGQHTIIATTQADVETTFTLFVNVVRCHGPDA